MNNQNTDNLELASTNRRLLAFLIDDMLMTLLVYFVFWDNIAPKSDDLEAMLFAMNSLLVPILVVKFIYQTLFVWYYGASIGKIITKIKVIDYNNFGRVSLFTSIIRSFGRLASEMFFYIGFIIAFLTEGRQTFHDKIGKTLVVNA